MSDNSFHAPSPEYLAQLLPQYDIEFFIAQGGMGAVYKGRQISLDRDIAIKILPQEVGQSVEFQESFISEAKAMARLNHPNLLGVFDYGMVEGMSYIVMEYVDGGSLHQAAWNQAVEAVQAVTIVKGICDGLSHAHKNGIVHRDIKPSNILLTPSAEPKVADFGLAHAADSDKPGLVMGTPGYTAPEVFQDPNQAGPLADIYSVGVILNQLLTGIDPAGSMVPPTQATGNLRLDTIWRKATNISPAQRYQSIGAMADDLDKWLVAKQKLAVGTTAASVGAPRRHVPVQTHRGGGNLIFKLFIICILAALVVFTYQMLEKRKQRIKDDLARAAAQPKIVVAPPVPVSLPPVEVKPVIPEPTDDDDDDDADEEPEVVVEDKPKPKPEPTENLPPGDPDLQERAVGLILDARKKRDKELADNASALHFSLRALSSDAKPDLLDLLEKVKGDTVDGRIPIIDGVYGLPPKMVDAFNHHRTKEQSIDAKYRADLTVIRNHYVTRLTGASTETSDEKMKRRLLAQSERASDLDAWIQLLSPEPKRVVKRSAGVLAGVFIGKWEIHEGSNVSRWIAHPDGKLEIVDKKWEAFWEVLPNGTLEVRWTGKKPYKMEREGDKWVGKSPFGAPVTFKRGDW